MDSESFKKNLVFYVLGIVPVVWLALLAAPYMHGGLIGIVKGLAEAFEQPFNLHGQENSVKTILIFLAEMCIRDRRGTDEPGKRRAIKPGALWREA